MQEYSPDKLNSIVQAFNNNILTKSDWNHDAHIIIAFWHNLHFHFPDALQIVKGKIKRYNEQTGIANTQDSGYHETLTIFWMTLTKNYLLEYPDIKFKVLVSQFLRTEKSKKDYVFQFYTDDLLFSKQARINWIEGDRKTVSLQLSKLRSHLDLSDIQFLTALENCSLPSNLFNHEAHLRLAFINIEQSGIEKATEIICKQITDFVRFLGAEDKYNKTLTIAATRAVYHFMSKSKSTYFSKFINEFPRLRYNFKEIIDSHYGFDIFNSEKAKVEYLAPDLLPFD